MNTQPHPAANDDGATHDLFSTLKALARIPHLPVRQLAWLTAALEGRDITRLTVGELLNLTHRAHTLPRTVQGGAQ